MHAIFCLLVVFSLASDPQRSDSPVTIDLATYIGNTNRFRSDSELTAEDEVIEPEIHETRYVIDPGMIEWYYGVTVLIVIVLPAVLTILYKYLMGII